MTTVSETGYRITAGGHELHVRTLNDLEIRDPSGELVDITAVDRERMRDQRLKDAGYLLIRLESGSVAGEGLRLNPWQAEAISRVLPALAARLEQQTAESADAIVARMIASVPSGSGRRWQELIGPFYSANDVATWRGVSRQHIHKLRKQGVLLGAQTGDAKLVVFPAWQFGLEGQPLPHLREVVALLGHAAPDEWAQALWLHQKTERFGGRSAADLLKAGETERVLEAARADASRLAA